MLSRSKPGCPARRTRIPARKHRSRATKKHLAAMQSVLWEKRFACAIRITGDSCCDRRCLVCGRVPSDPHHLTFTQPRALGRRVSDEFIVPVCRVHHRELHRSGNEVAWWRKLNIDPIPIALRLWQQTRTDGGDPKIWKTARLDEGEPIPRRQRQVPLVMELQKRRPRDGRYAQRDGAL